jgi:Cu/Zn superoxide dismutase
MAENGSATAGTVVIQASQSSFTVTVSATGLPPSSAHTANIHEGQCASPGPTLYPLKDVVADASGKASITTSVQTPFAPTGRGWYVDVFTTAAGTRRLACANLPAA